MNNWTEMPLMGKIPGADREQGMKDGTVASMTSAAEAATRLGHRTYTGTVQPDEGRPVVGIFGFWMALRRMCSSRPSGLWLLTVRSLPPMVFVSWLIWG